MIFMFLFCLLCALIILFLLQVSVVAIIIDKTYKIDPASIYFSTVCAGFRRMRYKRQNIGATYSSLHLDIYIMEKNKIRYKSK